jgi:uncharacterized protein
MDYAIGFMIAVVIALTGVGAGVITAPLLILFLRVPPDVAVSTALAFSAIVKLIVAPVQIARRQVNYRVLGRMLLGGVPGVVIGSLSFKKAVASGASSSLSFALGAIIIFTAAWHIYRHFHPAGVSRPIRDRSLLMSLIMLPIGAEVGFSSSGAGALGTLSLLSLTNLPATEVVGTDLAFGLAIALIGSGVHMIGGQYATSILMKMAIGGVFGGILASGVAPKIPNRTLRLALSFWLIIIGIQFCYHTLTPSKAPAAEHHPSVSKGVFATQKTGRP